MKRKLKAVVVAACLVSGVAQAGLAGVTAHSRANCAGFNESVTWQAGSSYTWRVESHHIPEGWTRPLHILNTGTVTTWRAWVGHITEAYSTRGDKWWVNGFHFFYPNGRERMDVMTSVGDCSIYDGWWN